MIYVYMSHINMYLEEQYEQQNPSINNYYWIAFNTCDKYSSKNNQKKNFENEAEIFIGCVYGQVRYSPDGYYGDMPAPYTHVKIGNKHDISSIIGGSYKINGLALDQEYTITYSNSRFKTKTTNVTITKEHPCVEKYLFFYSDDEKETIQKNSDNSKLVNKAKTTKISNENYIDLTFHDAFSIHGKIHNPIKKQEEGKTVIEFTAQKVHITAISYVAYRGIFVFIDDWFTSETIVVPLDLGETPNGYYRGFKGIVTNNYIFVQTPFFIIQHLMAEEQNVNTIISHI